MFAPMYSQGGAGSDARPAQPQEQPLASVLPDATPNTMQYLRNVPDSMTPDELVAVLEEKGFKGTFNFLYLPVGDGEQGNRGFAFINFLKPESATAFSEAFHGKAPSECLNSPAVGAKACEVLQARLVNVDKSLTRWRTNTRGVKGEKKKAWAPMLYDEEGKATLFPAGPAAPALQAEDGKGKGKAKGKGKKGKDEKGAGKGGPAPPPPPMSHAGYGFPDMGYQMYPGMPPYPGMPRVNPQYAAAMAQAAHIHARAAAAANAGQQQGRGLLEHLAPAVSGTPQVLNDEQRVGLRKQIEFYFSVENLCKDLYLRAHMNAQGWTPIELISQFPLVRKFHASMETVLEVLKTSPTLEVDEATRYLRLKDAVLRNKWATVPTEYRQNLGQLTTKQTVPPPSPAVA